MARPRNHQSPPHRQQLQQALLRLHTELAGAKQLDSTSKKLLREVLIDIERALGEPPPPAGARGSSAPRVEALAVEFEARHPAIAGSLRQLIDLLVRAGM